MRPPSTRVYHEIGGHGLCLSRLGIAHPTDAPVLVYQLLYDTLALQRHIGMLQRALPHTVFEKATALAVEIDPEVAPLSYPARKRKCLASGEIEPEVSAHAAPYRPEFFQCIDETRIQRRHHLQSPQ